MGNYHHSFMLWKRRQQTNLFIYIPNGGKKGEITFGGVNEAHLKKDTAVSVKIEAGERMYIKMKKLMLGDIEACKENDASCKALVDTGCTDIKGPKDIVNKFLKEKMGKLTVSVTGLT